MKYLDLEGIREAFGQHLIKHRNYSADEVMIAVSDFPDPYSNCYLREDFLEEVEIDGVEYQMYTTIADFTRFGGDTTPFRFYTYYRSEDVADHTVLSYMNARKMYRVEELDEDDFPY